MVLEWGCLTTTVFISGLLNVVTIRAEGRRRDKLARVLFPFHMFAFSAVALLIVQFDGPPWHRALFVTGCALLIGGSVSLSVTARDIEAARQKRKAS